MKRLSRSPRETSDLAKLFAEEILKTKPGNKALVVGFVGELGTGKTTFIKSFLRALGIKTRIVSPTFIFSRPYKLIRKQVSTVWHFDVYRLNSLKGIKEIGLRDAIKNPENMVLVEWADKIKNALPEGTIWIKIKHGQKPDERNLTFSRR